MAIVWRRCCTVFSIGLIQGAGSAESPQEDLAMLASVDEQISSRLW